MATAIQGNHYKPPALCSLAETRRRYEGAGGAVLALGSIVSLHEPLVGRLFCQGNLDVSHSRRILDVGVGAGQLLKHLVKHAAPRCRIVALDFSGTMLSRAQARVGSTRPLFMQGDLCRLPFANESFDCIACGRVLEHLPDVHQGLAEMARVLEPGGQLFLLATEDTWAGTALSKAWRCQAFNRNSLRSMCERIGLPWHEELWLTSLHRLCGMGGIIVRIRKRSSNSRENR